MAERSEATDGGINRRRALQALSATAAVGLAGCSFGGGNGGGNGGGGNGGGGNGGGGNGGGNGGGEAGERVPTLDLTYWSNVSFTPIAENILPVVTDNMSTLGIDVELRPTEFTTEIVEQIEDQRTRHLQLWYYTSDPGRLDPNPMLERFFAERAGATGQLNTSNYVNCDYTVAGHEQAAITDDEERRQKVYEAHSIIAEDAVINPLSPVINVAAVRTDEVETNGVGDAGILHHNPYFYIESSPKNGDTIEVDTSPVTTESSHYQVLDSTPSLSLWNHLVSSTLVEWDNTYELQNMLAEEINFSDDGTVVEVTVRDDAQFQNGDPVTAEDVQFTFQYLWERPGEFPQLEVPPYESIEVTGDRTTEFTFERPYAPLLQRNWATWGILHKDSWVNDFNALESDSIEPGTDLIGSGPFELAGFSQGESMRLSPADTHPVHEPDHEIVINVFRDMPPKVQAFKNNEIQVMTNIPFSVYEDINETMDTAETVIAEGYLPWGIFHNYPVAPSKFRPYRQAVGMCFDRQLINEVAFRGESYEPLQAVVHLRNHPYQPPEDQVEPLTDDPSGDMEGARQVLEEAGWSWDDDGNLRYPPDADLEPLWPAEQTPNPDDFPCLNADGEFQFPN